MYSLAWLTCVGLGDYIKKLVLDRGGDRDIFLLVSYIFYVPLFWINALFQGTLTYDYHTIQAALFIGISNFGAPLWILTSLKYLNVSFAFVTIRIISSFAILFIGLFILWDSLTLYNILWFLLGAFAIFLLSGFTFGQKLNLHPKGIIALCIAVVCIVFWNSYYKYMVDGVQIHDYVALQFSVSAMCIILYMIGRRKTSQITLKEVQKVVPYSLITAWIFFLFFLYVLPNIYLLGPLSLGYKMISYSLIVPIILSIIFLWESVNKTKIFAFWLTIISIFLFLI